MHDFLQHLSFRSESPFPATRSSNETLRRLTLSFNEVPAPYRSSPRGTQLPRPLRKSSQPRSHRADSQAAAAVWSATAPSDAGQPPAQLPIPR